MKARFIVILIFVALVLTALSFIYVKDTTTTNIKNPKPIEFIDKVIYPVGGCLTGSGKVEKGFPFPVLSYDYSCTKSPDNGTQIHLFNLVINFVIYLVFIYGGSLLIKRKS